VIMHDFPPPEGRMFPYRDYYKIVFRWYKPMQRVGTVQQLRPKLDLPWARQEEVGLRDFKPFPSWWWKTLPINVWNIRIKELSPTEEPWEPVSREK